MKKKTILVLIGLAIIGTIGFLYKEKSMGAMIYPATFTNLIGTRTASTTAGVGWYGNLAASTTYPFALGGAEDATIVFDTTAASTSASTIHFSVLGSVDPNCSTATTSTSYNLMTKAQVRWFDAMPFIDNAAVISSFSNGTSTIVWDNPIQIQRAIHFTDLNFECLSVEMNASSTIVHASYKLK